jgi:hypothetical protein
MLHLEITRFESGRSAWLHSDSPDEPFHANTSTVQPPATALFPSHRALLSSHRTTSAVDKMLLEILERTSITQQNSNECLTCPSQKPTEQPP